MRQSRERVRGDRKTGEPGKRGLARPKAPALTGPGPAVPLWWPSEQNRSGGSRNRGERALPLRPRPSTPSRRRRDEPPLSIDLTFHLLRHLLLLARAQSQRARADSNRRILDAVGR
uniref:Uncharacterized protein n=1 Tax=Geospiza parvula TaxID=87175 RepID=A0A8C3N3Y3_GEOPR